MKRKKQSFFEEKDDSLHAELLKIAGFLFSFQYRFWTIIVLVP